MFNNLASTSFNTTQSRFLAMISCAAARLEDEMHLIAVLSSTWHSRHLYSLIAYFSSFSVFKAIVNICLTMFFAWLELSFFCFCCSLCKILILEWNWKFYNFTPFHHRPVSVWLMCHFSFEANWTHHRYSKQQMLQSDIRILNRLWKAKWYTKCRGL